MDYETQLELQAFLDGELPEKKARDIAALIARDAEARDLLAELRNTRQVLAGFEPDRKVTESREFYWSRIERAIRSVEPEGAALPSGSIFGLVRRFLIPAGAVAALALCVMFAVSQSGSSGPLASETALSQSNAFTYHDDANGTTLVWLNYPAESEFADNGSH